MRKVAVTTTHDRPLMFTYAEWFMAGQTVLPDLWIIVNDSERPEQYEYNYSEQFVVNRTYDPNDPMPSICLNWLEALKHIEPADHVFVWEDDDYYDPQMICCLNEQLINYDLAGVSKDVYFRFPTRRFQRMHNDTHASLACTAFRGTLAKEIERIIHQHKSVFIDQHLWSEAGSAFPCRKSLVPQPRKDGKMYHVGMKGMPGARGLGIGHQNMNSGSTDPAFAVLREWIDAETLELYKHLWKEIHQQN